MFPLQEIFIDDKLQFNVMVNINKGSMVWFIFVATDVIFNKGYEIRPCHHPLSSMKVAKRRNPRPKIR